jgi:hypothetical protein
MQCKLLKIASIVMIYRCVMDPSGKRAGWSGFPRDMADILSPAVLSGEFRDLRSAAQSKSSVDIYFEGDMMKAVSDK